jgi:hypothetical protein
MPADTDKAQRYLLLFKLDAKNLCDRIRDRKPEYLEIFALKRTREHFQDIFYTRYYSAGFQDFSHCNEETISALDQFYKEVEQLKWYLNHTQDMPNTISDHLDREIHKIENFFNMVALYIDAELGVHQDDLLMEQEEFSVPVEKDEFSDDTIENS